MVDQNSTASVQALLNKEDSSAWLIQGGEAFFIAALLLTIVFVVIKAIRMKKDGISFDNKEQASIELKYAKRVTNKSTAIVVEWKDSEYLFVESANGVELIDKVPNQEKQES